MSSFAVILLGLLLLFLLLLVSLLPPSDIDRASGEKKGGDLEKAIDPFVAKEKKTFRREENSLSSHCGGQWIGGNASESAYGHALEA